MVTQTFPEVRRLGLKLALASVLFAGGAAFAQAKVVVVPFNGPQAARARDQMVEAVCGPQAECVPQHRVVSAGKTDWDAVRKEGAHLVVAARAAGPVGKRVLTVEAYDTRPRLVFREKVTLSRNGLIPKSNLQKLAARIGKEATSRAGDAKAPPEPAPTPPEASTSDDPAAVGAQPGDDEAEAAEEPEQVAAPPPPRSADAPPLVAVEAGLFIAHRTFEYQNLLTTNLRSYVTRPAMFGPRLRVEAYPLTQVTHGPVTHLGLELELESSLFLRSVDENDQGYPTRYLRYELGLRYGVEPLPEQALTLWPVLGYRGGGFTTGNNDAGERLVGLPNVGYGSVYGGVEGAFGLKPVTLLLRAVYLHGLDPGEVGGDAFFPESSSRGFEISAGAGYPIHDLLEARARVLYTRYGYAFTAADDATYRASGAVDAQVGLTASVRYTF